MLISVHMPKTAGTSFRIMLQEHFGDSLLRDQDMPMMRPVRSRQRRALASALWLDVRGMPPSIDCVHGHFLPVKYLLYASTRNATFVTWLRDPVDRAISHYYYMRRTKPGNPMHRRIVEEDWSLERFALGHEFQNFYSQYFWGFPLEKFSFVGIQEFYSADVAAFSKEYMRARPREVRRNVGEGESASVTDQLRSDIAEHHAEDLALYERALAMRAERGRAASQ